MRLISLICVLGTLGYVKADCYPGNTAFTNIVQEIYKGVTSDNIILKYLGTSAINRQNLCQILVTHHNHGKNSGQFETNRQFLGNLHIWKHICVNALTYTTGYNSLTGWQNWAGYHSGKWYAETKIFSDGAMWYTPYSKYESGQMYAVQPVRFDSKWRKDNCHTKDSTGATCRNGWNQSGSGVSMQINIFSNIVISSVILLVKSPNNLCTPRYNMYGVGIPRTTAVLHHHREEGEELMLGSHSV